MGSRTAVCHAAVGRQAPQRQRTHLLLHKRPGGEQERENSMRKNHNKAGGLIGHCATILIISLLARGIGVPISRVCKMDSLTSHLFHNLYYHYL